MKPYTPDEAIQNQASLIPDVVFEATNHFLAKQALSRRIVIRKRDLIDKILELGGPNEDTLYQNKWLDVEIAYRLQGWNVEYESPDWGDSGGGYYAFTRREKPTVPQPTR